MNSRSIHRELLANRRDAGLHWTGREGLDEFDARVEDKTVLRGQGLPFPPMAVRGLVIKGRGGEPLFDKRKVTLNSALNGPYQVRSFMEVTKQMVLEATDEVAGLAEAYLERIKQFRGQVKNDIAAVKSAHSAVETTVNAMSATYARTAAMLTSPEFEKAIANAERMATALGAISALQSHSITFAVLDKKPT